MDTAARSIIVSRRWVNRGTHGGYERLCEVLQPIRVIAHEDRFKRPYRLLRALGSYANNDGYSSISAGLESRCIMESLIRCSNHLHFLYGDYDLFYSARYSKQLRLVVSASFHNPPEEIRRRLRRIDHLRGLKGIIVLGSSLLEFMSVLAPQADLCCIPHGIDTEFFCPEEFSTTKRKQIAIVGAHLRDWELTKKILLRLRVASNTFNVITCLPDEYRSRLPQESWIINKHPVSDTELRDIYRTSMVLLYIPKDCVASNAVLESMSCGTPIVTVNRGSVAEYVSDKAGFVGKPSDVEGIVEKLLTLLGDTEYQKACGVAAREQAKQKDWHIVRQLYLSFFERVCQ